MTDKNDVKQQIDSNVDELNKILRRMSALEPALAKKIIKTIAFGIYRDIVEKTPVDTGTARRGWKIDPFNQGFGYKIYNPVEYIIYLEYGVKGHPLSSNPQKRKNSLRYLFATGILVGDTDGIRVHYFYEAKNKKSEGFIRNTINEWRI